MNNKMKVLLLGDNKDSWHPLEPIQKELEKMIGKQQIELNTTDDYNTLSTLTLDKYDVFISYTDSWNRKWTPEQTNGLRSFVDNGGGLVAIHNGISLQSSVPLQPLIGARFIGHPPAQTLNYYGAIKDHPILKGVNNFSMVEEPYRVEFGPNISKNVFLEFEYNGQAHPAAWEKTYGHGRVVYLQPGHSNASFQPSAFQQLVLNSIYWVSKSNRLINLSTERHQV